ncbi:MAG: DNA mismatch repair endonuclease MutL [Candidatus Aminicenantes bacterium]|nr:DNA mismatch repair endonuclease MutL [Candidatus Aminicenantes bacterium]
MSRIFLLPPEVSRKIAAGEVIERPVSVVKELVENSLDAGADEISVELAGGGKRSIKVTDNGQGMSCEDAAVCFERHSTSKISRLEDLSCISTLGFRGEALPSISAVSQVLLRTSDGKGAGTLIEREGSDQIRLEDTAFPRGTSVEVNDLFFNLPAREKFLKSDRSELSAIVKSLTQTLLVHPSVRFSLRHGKREIYAYPSVGSLKERIFQVFGREVVERLLEIRHNEGSYQISGYSSKPPAGRSDRRHQFFFVNKRPVKEKTLQAALNRAYKGLLEKDLSPEAFLLIDVPLDEVDVNVHPAKEEVRFRNTGTVFMLVTWGIERSVLKEKGLKVVRPEEHAADFMFTKKPLTFQADRVEEKKPGRHPDLGFIPPEKGIFPAEDSPRVLGQYLDMYIVAVEGDGLVIIDQHNAHERVLFEQYKRLYENDKWPRKMPMFPLLVEFSPSQALNWENNREMLEKTGFLVEPMGKQTYAIKEFPEVFTEEEAKKVLFSLLDEVNETGVEKRKDRILATLACRTAIKAGLPLSQEKMACLVEELFQTSNPAVCPHGRPVVIRFERKDIEKNLGR